MADTPHIPVLLTEVLSCLDCPDGGLVIDGTFGAGGYTRAMLRAHPTMRVVGFDRDPNAIQTGMAMEDEFKNRFTFIHDCFGNMSQHIEEKVDGIVLDLGISSMQIDQPERGFSLRFDGPLDMRMGQQGKSAKDIVNGASEKEIADILFMFGEEKASRRIARAIVKAREVQPITTTAQLADLIHSVMPRPKDGSDSATRSFQALRIAVNDELGELQRALESALHLLKPGGRLVVVSFHSLEDRIVKNFFIRHSSARPNVNRHAAPQIVPDEKPFFEILTKKPMTPTEAELILNPRSHSAKLRAAVCISEVNV